MPKRKANKVSKKVTSARRVGAQRAGAKSASAKPDGKALAARSARKTKAAPRAAARKQKVEPVPSRYGTATPHLIVSPCAEALEFYTKAFGAKVVMTMPGPGGLIMHSEIKIGDSIVMCSDELEMPGAPNTRKTPRNAGATTGGVMLFLKDVDAFFERAIGAGATSIMPPSDQFWGDRYGQLEDPFGHVWAVATHLRDMSTREMQKAMAQVGAPEA